MIKAGIICGCLPTQLNIEPGDLYHQLIAQKIRSQFGVGLDVVSIWYTTLAESTGKVLELIAKENPDLVLYHVRPDPYLRISKLFVRYKDLKDQFRIKFNFNGNDQNISDGNPTIRTRRGNKKKSGFNIFLRELNYRIGYIAGINTIAIKKEFDTLKEISSYCRDKDLFLVIIGPASRPRSKMEEFLLQRLDESLFGFFRSADVNYVRCFGATGKNGESLFFEDKVHVNRDGHKRFSELLYPEIEKYITNNRSQR